MSLMRELVTAAFHEWVLSKANESNLQWLARGAADSSDSINHQLSGTKESDKKGPGDVSDMSSDDKRGFMTVASVCRRPTTREMLLSTAIVTNTHPPPPPST